MPDTPSTSAAHGPRLDMLLVLLFLAGGIFAASWVAGWTGFWCWLIGAADVLIARTAWRRFRD